MDGLTRRALLGALGLATAAAATGCGDRGAGGAAPPRALSFKGIDITGADYANVLSLPDAQGQPAMSHTLAALDAGKRP